ncbi:hypothetical protein [Brevibacterium sp. ZH18]|uniref:hypothetical protein n=1 Tax=Brevibacterium sp. ZH18 TaxID=2927784 RepID=UPI00325B842C
MWRSCRAALLEQPNYSETDEHFRRAVSLLDERGLDYWADPQRSRLHETNTEHGGRGVYFFDPSGMYLELITKPYL